tara:strand:+ start:124 stop:456 length:333 start_codon:yes stop_codon:yes gene_type:complete
LQYRSRKKYIRYYRDANDSLERQTQEALDQGHSKHTAAAPLAAPRFIDVISTRTIEDMLLFQPLRVYLGLLIEVSQIKRTKTHKRNQIIIVYIGGCESISFLRIFFIVQF